MSSVPDPSECGRAAYASLSQLGIIPTPDNFAIWYECHTGLNPELNHMIDALLNNRRRFDAPVLAAIHKRFFARATERDALHQAAERIQALVQEVGSLVGDAGTDASQCSERIRDSSHAFAAGVTTLPELIQLLGEQASEMAERSDRLGQHLAGAAERVQMLERSLDAVRHDAATDGLTGLNNRRSFDAKLREVADQAMNSDALPVLLLVDIDHFKRFNDTWGHQVGDQVLRLVAATLTANLRPDDVIARYGGEEFAIILPATAATEAAQVADRVRRAFEGRRLVTRVSGKTIDGVTVSIGGACYDPGEAPGDWIERADKALYAAKSSGRNRVAMAPADDKAAPAAIAMPLAVTAAA